MKFHYEKFGTLVRLLSDQMEYLLYHTGGGVGRVIYDDDISIEDAARAFEDYIEDWTQLDFCFDDLLRELIDIDQIARQAVIRKCCETLDIEFIADWIRKYDDLCDVVDDYYINRALGLYLSLYVGLHEISKLFDIQMTDILAFSCIANFIDEHGYARYYFPRESINESPQAKNNEPKYKTIPRTHRIAAVWGLIDKLKLRSSMDKTILAAFVEAVTGGNIESRPKDTVSYKEPEATAKEAAAELLKKIGVE